MQQPLLSDSASGIDDRVATAAFPGIEPSVPDARAPLARPRSAMREFLATLNLPGRIHDRFLLSRAKHPSLRGHPRWARRLVRWIRHYEYADSGFFCADDAPAEIEVKRRAGFEDLARRLAAKRPKTIAASRALSDSISDVEFTSTYRVPFPFRTRVSRDLEPGCIVAATSGVKVCDLDGNWSYDLSGSYGVNLFGNDFYKRAIDDGAKTVRELGPLLGSYHPVIAKNVERLLAISGQDQVSFHMSGTEAVMQAVRLARYHTKRSHVVRFCGAYHGWWDGVQAGVGNPRPAREVYTLTEMSDLTLDVIASRKDIACVLVNPLQALHPNGNAPSDSMLVTGVVRAGYDRAAYTAWLRRLREVCSRAGVPLIFDEVFLGFRLARGGAQEYFGVRADLVTYGKSLGGGLPIGVLCGRLELMRRFDPDHPTDICFARGTFNSHPYVMGAMSAFLDHLESEDARDSYAGLDARWDARARTLNERLERLGVPVRFANLASVWTTVFTAPGRYHWMFQFYLRDHGLALSWIGSGRFIFSHAYTDADFEAVADRIVAAAGAMERDGFFFRPATLTEETIRKAMFRETLRARFGLPIG